MGWIQGKVRGLCYGILQKTSLAGLELYKILVAQKGILILALLALYLVNSIHMSQVFHSPLTTYLNKFYTEMEGVPGEEAEAYVDELAARMETVEETYQTARLDYSEGRISFSDLENARYTYIAYEVERGALTEIRTRLESLERLREETGIQAWLLNATGYKYLLDEPSWEFQRTVGLGTLFVLILLFSGLFSYERQSGTRKMIFPLRKGRKELYVKKRAAALIAGSLVFFLVYGIPRYDVWHSYGLHALGAPVQSLEFMEAFPIPCSIAAFYLGLSLLRLLLIWAISGMVSFFSSFLSMEKSVLAGIFLLAAPSALWMAGLFESRG